jgi:hypothetical protein
MTPEDTDLLRRLVSQQIRTNTLLADIAVKLKPQHSAAEWQKANPLLAASCREATETLNKVFAAQLQAVTEEIVSNSETLMDSDFARREFLDGCGPRMSYLQNLLAMLNQLGTVATPTTASKPQ